MFVFFDNQPPVFAGGYLPRKFRYSLCVTPGDDEPNEADHHNHDYTDKQWGDATAFFNGVTGASQPLKLQQLAAAPNSLRPRIVDLIDAETRRAREGQIFSKRALVSLPLFLKKAKLTGENRSM